MKQKAPRLSKAAFIRKHPSATPENVSGMAQAKGVTITPQYVRNVRHYDSMAETAKETAKEKADRLRKKASKVVAEVNSPEGHKVKMSDLNLDSRWNARAVPPEPGEGLVKAFKCIAIALGLSNARRLLTETEDEVARVFGRPPIVSG